MFQTVPGLGAHSQVGLPAIAAPSERAPVVNLQRGIGAPGGGSRVAPWAVERQQLVQRANQALLLGQRENHLMKPEWSNKNVRSMSL